jgi:hypothetical protein
MKRTAYFLIPAITLKILLSASSNCAAQQENTSDGSDTTACIERKLQGAGGSAFTVPDGKSWVVQELTISSGSYPIRINSVKYPDTLQAGEKLRTPSWLSEAELLSEAEYTDLIFSFKIKEYAPE